MANALPQLAPGKIHTRNVFDVLEGLPKGEGAKNILICVDFNVPMTPEFKITDDLRIRGALPTIQAVLKSKNNCILMSHMGRPKLVQKGEDANGAKKKQLTLNHVVKILNELSGIGYQDL